MSKVNNHNYSQFKNILYKANPSFSSIVAGNSRGELWVNNIKKQHLPWFIPGKLVVSSL